MCMVGNPIILHGQIISFSPKKEKENGILKFIYLYIHIYIYIYSKNPLWLRIISRVKRRFFQGCEIWTGS